MCILSAHAHHWLPKKHQMNLNARVGPAHIFKQQKFSQKIRFEVVYDYNVQELDEAKFSLVTEKLIPKAVKYFHDTLRVRPSKAPLKLQRACKDNAYYLKDSNGTKSGDRQFCKLECVVTKCGPVTVPTDHLDRCRICDSRGARCSAVSGEKMAGGFGVEAKDFILYVSAVQTSHCTSANAVAYASYCQQERATDRPIAGFANICPDRLGTDERHFSNLLATIKHEIYHALGFSAGLFAFYRDSNDAPYTKRTQHGSPVFNEALGLYQWSDRVVRKVARKRWAVKQGFVSREVNMLVTPRVKAEVRRHFACPSLEGAELENQGGVGTALTHWEKRVFENEAMTGTYTQNPVFSRITLALMDDTGWYRANYSMAEELDWGRGKGCVFAKASCKTWMESHLRKQEPADPFCFTIKKAPLHMRCTHSRLSLALCNLKKYDQTLPEEYQYFSYLPAHEATPAQNAGKWRETIVRETASYGGAVALADFCPFYQKFTLTGTGAAKRETTCNLAQNAPSESENYGLETFGSKSRCIEQGRPWTAKKELLTRTMLDWGSGCYRVQCRAGLQVEVAGKTYPCQRRGQLLEVSGKLHNWRINGSLVCPSCEEFCGRHGGCPTHEANEFQGTALSDKSSGSPVVFASLSRTFLGFVLFLALRE